jgi:superfamily II DNA or RNA helicase
MRGPSLLADSRTSASAAVQLTYVGGTLEVHGLSKDSDLGSEINGDVKWDGRSRCWRCAAHLYATLVKWLVRSAIEYEDQARAYQGLTLRYDANGRRPRPYQTQALDAWRKLGAQGVVVLPTGAGKSLVALLAIADRQRSAIVVAPTLDLVRQWYDLLTASFAVDVGLLGGGDFDIKPITVATYDSAHLHAEHWGNRFGLVVFDEVHHLPSPSYQLAARLSLAPFRLGLTATPERTDGAEACIEQLVGPIVYRRDIVEMTGEFLADYETSRIAVHLTPEEREQYEAARGTYLNFARRHGIKFSGPNGWSRFIQRAACSKDGRRALDAYRIQKTIAVAATEKLRILGDLLVRHGKDRCLIFTLDNLTVYDISRRFLIPALTHQTNVKERSEILACFMKGEYGAVVTSRVLNEGVDVPEANVAIVVSGTGSVREHVQRLGRILRPRDGKRAMLYELVTSQTAETQTSERRRDHLAYR